MTNVKTAVEMEMLAAEAQSKIAYFCLKLDQRAAHMATSMAQFAADKPALNLGEYWAWKDACYREGRTIPPDEFRAWPDDKRHPPARTSATAHKTRYD